MPGFWRKCRIAFRCLRFGTWALILAVLGLLLWCNRVGLPDFVKARLVATLSERGVKLEFSKLRLSFRRGFVAEEVRIGETNGTAGVTLAVRQVQLNLNFSALLHRRWQLDGLVLRDGQFILPLAPTNALTLTNLQTELRFQADDTWSLDHFRANFSGTQIVVTGELAHAPDAGHWKIFAGSGGDRGATLNSLNVFADALQNIRFQGVPQLLLNVTGDARDVHSLVVRLNAAAPGVRTPWFAASNFVVAAELTAPANAPTNCAPADGFWTNLQPFRLAWSVRLGGLRSTGLAADRLACAGVWAAPTLTVSSLSAQLDGGKIETSAALDVPTRTVTFTNAASFEPRALAPLLPEKARGELAQFCCPQPAVLRANGSVGLPAWSTPAEKWPDALKNSLQLDGAFAVTNLEYRGALVDAVRTHFSFGDLMLTVPDFTVAQGKTRLTLNGQASAATGNFRCRLAGAFDPAGVRMLLTDRNAAHGFGLLTFSEPLALALEVDGNLRTPETLNAAGNFALTNAAIRRQTVDRLTAGVTYSNLTAVFLQPQLSRAGGAQAVTAEKVILDFAGQRLFISGGVGHLEPMVVGRAIGPKTAEAMAPYQFLAIPTVRVNGCIPLKQRAGELVTEDADIRFDVVGNVPFRWRKFETPAITGTVHWWKNFIILTNAVADCYGGEGRGWGNFDVSPEIRGTDLSFFMTGTNVDFHRMGTALWSPTNRLEGALSGTVAVTRANSDDWRTWNGSGEVKLQDGLLWDVPVIALMSPALDAVSPGLGNSRATEATARFALTNGVIVTDSLVIRSTAMRLQYAGTVDLEQNLDAKVTAQLLRNTPFVGSVFSVMLWPVSKIFECRVTGQLGEPRVTPLYVPKLLLVPLHPLRSLEEWFTPAPATNAPAGK